MFQLFIYNHFFYFYFVVVLFKFDYEVAEIFVN